MPLDNSTLPDKARLRRRVLASWQRNVSALTRPHALPMVLETHGGFGRIYEQTWHTARGGVVIEKDGIKADHLARQRPTWRVYQGDCEKCLAEGLAAATPFDIIDLDPYGQPFDVLAALALPGRQFPREWHLVVNDGTRQAIQRGVSWHMASLARQVRKYGTQLSPIYLDVARDVIEEFAKAIGFAVTGWVGHYAGHNNLMTHYWARLARA